VKSLALILAVSLGGAVGGAGDWALIVSRNGSETGICAKSRATCEAARKAIAGGLWPIVPPETPTACIPWPGCFRE